MERVNLGYSVKNIPTPSERTYKKQLVESIEAVIKRMRWKAIFFDPIRSDPENDPEDTQNFDNYGLKTARCPAQVNSMRKFEADLMNIASNITFRKGSNDLQRKMKRDMKEMRDSKKTLTPADKTTNLYRLTKEQYDQLKMNAITSTYKKGNAKLKEKIDKNGTKYAKKAGVLDRMQINGNNQCFVTLKDHKDNFENNPKTRLINPAKNEIGRISKAILDKINKKLKEKLGVNQWKNTASVLEWFKGIQNKQSYTFVVFDVKDFYPSISESLLKEALIFAKNHVSISKNDEDTIFHARKSLLFDKTHVWIKKDGGLFDVTMGAFDGAEVCELVGTYLLSKIAQKYNKNDIGLYRDDGLGVMFNTSGPQNEKIKKDFVKIFKDNGLEIVIQCNLKVTNFLDVTLNLTDGTYKPYRKPDDETNYVHVESDHPPTILKQLPIAVEKRISDLSANEEIFNNAKNYYQEALKKSGYSYQIKYNPTTTPNPGAENRRKRGRKILWFNPPYSRSVETDVGKQFLRLLDVHFPRHDPLHKIFNRNNVKVSYGCMPNMKAYIGSHNKKILECQEPLSSGECNCRNPDECPLPNQCTMPNILYEATIDSDLAGYEEKAYKGISKPPFKERFGNHKKSFNNVGYKTDTELSKEVWKIKEQGGNYRISWRALGQFQDFNPANGKCGLCMSEKLAILEHSGPPLINSRSEIIATCRHRRKYMLSSLSDVT